MAGAGTGRTPCAQRTKPLPTWTGEAADAVRADQVEEQAAADDVRDRVHRADLVEMHLLGRNAVRVGFRLGDETVNGDRVRPDLGGQVESFDQRADIGKAVVMMPVRMAVTLPVFVAVFVRVRRLPAVLMLMKVPAVMGSLSVVVLMGVLMDVGRLLRVGMGVAADVLALLLLAAHPDADVGAGDAAFLHGFARDLHAGDAQRVHPGEKGRGIRQQLEQRGHQHVAAAPIWHSR